MGNTLEPAFKEQQCFGNVPQPCNLREFFGSDTTLEILDEDASRNLTTKYVNFLEKNIPNLYELDLNLLQQIVDINLYRNNPKTGNQSKNFFTKHFEERKGRDDLKSMVNKIQCVAVHYPPICDWLKLLDERHKAASNSDWLNTTLAIVNCHGH